jgi:hypothetical protein
LEFLRPLLGRTDVELIVRSGTMRDLLAQLQVHAIDVVLANTAPPQDARSSFRTHLLDEQPVGLVRRPGDTVSTFRDELAAGVLVEVCPIPNLSERFYAITQKRRFPNPLLGELLMRSAKSK